MLQAGDWFKVAKLDVGFTVRFPVGGLPESERPPLRAVETAHGDGPTVRMHQNDGLAFNQVVAVMRRVFNMAEAEATSPATQSVSGESLMAEQPNDNRKQPEAPPEGETAQGAPGQESGS